MRVSLWCSSSFDMPPFIYETVVFVSNIYLQKADEIKQQRLIFSLFTTKLIHRRWTAVAVLLNSIIYYYAPFDRKHSLIVQKVIKHLDIVEVLCWLITIQFDADLLKLLQKISKTRYIWRAFVSAWCSS